MEQLTDEEILEMYGVEDSRNMALHHLVKKYEERLYWHIRRMVMDHDDTHDILQDTFVKVWRGLASFRGDSRLYTWIYRVGTNECIDFLNKKKRQNIMSSDHAGYRMSRSLESDNFFKGDEIQLKLQKAILTLPEKQRIVFNMRYYDETPYDMMSEILDTSAGALKASYHIAAKKVEDYLLNH